jgi:hypothetical protein
VAEVSADWARTETGGLTCLVVGSALLVAPLAILVRWLQSIRRNREISYQTDSGRISVNLIAIEEALTRAVEGEPEVKKSHVRVFADKVRRSVVIEAVITLWEVPNVTDRNRFLQRLLRRRFAELMPEQSEVEVHLHLHRLTERRVEPKPQPVAAKPKGKSTATIADRTTTGDPPTDRHGSERDSGSRNVPALLSPQAINPVANALPGRDEREDDLYVGPTYPVDAGDEDEESRIPVAPPKRRLGGL